MTIDKSLKVKKGVSRSRNVLTRVERIEKMKEMDKWQEGESPFGLPEILFTMEDHRSAQILLLLEHQRIDIGITQTASPYPDLESQVLFDEEYRVVLKKKKKAVKADDAAADAKAPAKK